MRNLLLSVALIAVPVAGFSAVEMWLLPAPASQSASVGLGDLSPFAALVTAFKYLNTSESSSVESSRCSFLSMSET